jgi:hypothetical protein
MRAFQEEFQAAQSELKEIRNRSSQLEQEVQQTETTVRDLRQSLAAFQQDCDQTCQEMHTLRTGLTTLPLAVVEQELQDARKELDEIKVRSLALEEEFTTTGQTARTFQHSLQAATEEVRIGSEQGRTLQEEAVQTEGSLREFQQSLKTMRDELQTQSEDAHSTLLTIQQDCLTIERQIGEVRDDLDALRPPRLEPTPAPPAPPAAPLDAGPALELPGSEAAVGTTGPAPGERTEEPLPAEDRPEEGKVQLGVTVDQDAVVVAVLPETPAEKAGLQPGDVVLGVNERLIASSDDLRSAIHQAEPGQEVLLTVGRGTDTEEVKTQLAESPAQGS